MNLRAIRGFTNSSLPPWLGRLTEPHILFPVFGVLLLAMIWGATLNLIKVERAGAVGAAMASSQEQVETYEAQIVRNLREIDQTLKVVKYAYELKGDAKTLSHLKEKTLLPPDLLFVVGITDASGNVVANSRPTSKPNVADQDYFQAHREADADLWIGRPEPSLTAGEWKLVFSRRLNNANGGFAGIAMVTVDAAYFVSGYESTKLGEKGLLALLGADGVFRAKRTGERVSAGDSVRYASIVPSDDEANNAAKLMLNSWDNVKRYISVRPLNDFHLAVIVGLSETEQLAAAQRNMRKYVLAAVGSSILLIFVIALLGRMSWRLAQSRLRVSEARVATARQAGMAEIATNVLHNVGNVLNSVNVSADIVSSKLRASKVQGLSKAVKLMDEHSADLGDFLSSDEKGRLLPSYLAKLAEALEEEQRAVIDELSQLTKSVDHIKDIVATQQSYAGASSIVEPESIIDLVEDALRMNSGALVRHQVNVVKDFSPVPILPLDRRRILLILINLIGNAKYAMNEMIDGPRRMVVRIDTLNEQSLRVRVQDEGVGISKENLTRIFSHGFTTRKGGHGFGLHSCVIAASEMGGTLTAQSDGPNKGSTFTLLLPINKVQDAA